jgi:hypothetical protein
MVICSINFSQLKLSNLKFIEMGIKKLTNFLVFSKINIEILVRSILKLNM